MQGVAVGGPIKIAEAIFHYGGYTAGQIAPFALWLHAQMQIVYTDGIGVTQPIHLHADAAPHGRAFAKHSRSTAHVIPKRM
jgi:hypothetical protein